MLNNEQVKDLKICHVNLAKGFRGGERQTQILIQELSKAGVQQILLARSDSPLHTALAKTPGLTHVCVNKPYMRAMREVAKFNPQLIHAHDAKAAQWGLINFKLYKTPYLITRRVPNPLGDNFFTRAVYKNAAAIVGLSTAIKSSINNLIPEADVRIIPSMYASFPIDPDKLKQLKQRYQNNFVVGHIGALVDRHKGQALIIEAAERLAEQYPDICFLLLGEGEDEQKLKAMAKGLSSVEFIGFVQDVGAWIAVFDLFVFPSYQEGLGSTLLDAMQGDCPIIASAVDGILDVIEHNLNGLLVRTGDAEQLANAIEQLYLDADQRQAFAQAGQQRLGLYSPQHIAERYQVLYQAILDGNTTFQSN